MQSAAEPANSSMHPSRLDQREYTRLFSEAVAAHQPPSISTDVIDVIAGEKFTARIEVADGGPERGP